MLNVGPTLQMEMTLFKIVKTERIGSAQSSTPWGMEDIKKTETTKGMNKHKKCKKIF